MPNDITTLAIEIQSQEAERNLQSFNHLLEASSRTAGKMEKISIEVDVQAALQQINALKTGYDSLAASVQNIAGDINLGGIGAAPVAPAIDTTALETLKEFFASTAESSRLLQEELAHLAESMNRTGGETVKVTAAGSGAVTVSREHAEALRELKAAQKELAAETVKADDAMRATVEADKNAENAERELLIARRQLEEVGKALAATHSTMKGDVMGLSEKEAALKAKVAELTEAYQRAQAEAEKFNAELEKHGEKADAARAKIADLEKQIDAMPAPVAGSASAVGDFSQKLTNAGRDVTKVGRGIAYIGSMAGASIPGVSGLGRAISMLGMGNPYLIAAGLAIAGIAAAVKMYQDRIVQAAKAAKEFADIQQKISEHVIAQNEKVQSYMTRLAELNSYESTSNLERREMVSLMEKLGSVTGKTGMIYDQVTGKILNMADAERELTAAIVAREKQQIASEVNARKNEVALGEKEIKDQFSSKAGAFFEGSFNLKAIREDWDNAWNKEYDRVAKILEGYNAAMKNAKTTSEKQTVMNDLSSFLAQYRMENEGFAEVFDLDDVAASVEKQRTALENLAKAEDRMNQVNNQIGTRSIADVNRNSKALDARLEAERYASLSDDDKYKADGEKLRQLDKEQANFASMKGEEVVRYKGEELTVNEALKKIEIERLQLLRKRAAYEEKVANANVKKNKSNTTLGGVIQARKQEHNSLVNAVEANGVQRLALESRNFRTPENAFSKMAEETKKMAEDTTRIYREIEKMNPLLQRMADGSETMSDALATLG